MDVALALLLQLLKLAGSLLLVTVAALLVWAAASPFSYALLRVAERLRLPEAYAWLLRSLRALSPLEAWGAGYGAIPPIASSGPEVKVIIDERLASLREAMRRNVDAMKAGSSSVLALGGSKGPGAVAKDIRALQDRVEELADLGGEIPEGIVGDYQARAKSVFSAIILVLVLVAACLINGVLLNEFFKDLIVGRLAGIRLSYFVAVVFILIEFGLGYLAYDNREHRLAKGFFFVAIGLAALVEAIIFGFMSYSFDFDVPLLDDYPALRFWMGIVGIIVVPVTAGLGYALHRTGDELLESRGARRLRKEIRTINQLVRDLPDHWEGIRRKADAATSSIASFQSALGGREGALAGAVEKISGERAAMEQALVDARVESWPQWADGQAGDGARKRMQQIGLGVITIIGFAVFAFAMETLLGRAFRNWNEAVLIATAVLTGAAFYVVGWLSFERAQLLGERVYPLRAGTRETAIAAISALAATLAILIAGWRVGGTSGIAYALLLIAGGGVLAVLGYFLDDALRGLSIAGRLLVALALGLAAFLAAAVAHLLGWPFLAILGGTWLLLTLIAWPLELVVHRWNARRTEQGSKARPRKLQRVA